MKPVDFTCLALSSAGKRPEYGRNDLHVYNGEREWGYGWFCREAAECANTIGGGPEFSAHHWNRRHVGNKLDAPDGWRWGELRVERHFTGGKEVVLNKCFVGFLTEHPDIFIGGCIIDRPRHLHDLKVFDLGKRAVFDCPLPFYKRDIGSYAYANEAWCTDGTRWTIINVRVTTTKHELMFKELLASNE